MKNYSLFIIIINFLVSGCQNNTQTVKTDKAADKKTFFPVGDYIKSEISYVDSLPVAIMKYTRQGNQTDSAYIKPEEFHRLAQEFLPAELTTPVFEKEFSEVSFFDETTRSLTFTYSTKNNTLELQRADVLATPDQGYDKVKSIYLEKVIRKNDTLVVEKMYWKMRKNFQVVSSMRVLDQPAVIKQLKVVWDNSE